MIGRSSLTTPIVPTVDTSNNPADHRSSKKPIELQKPTKLLSNMNIKHAVFGYGSLMSSESAAITNPTLTADPFPCSIRGIERAWNKHSVKGFTAMGVQWAEEGSCVGVLYPVTDIELSSFDAREIGYGREAIAIENVDLVEYLELDEHYDSPDHKFFLKAVAERRSDVQIWVYVPLLPSPPDDDHPIVQTYVDIILQGCLDIHKDFAREFIEDTKGWNPQELLTDDEDDDDDEEEDDDDDNFTNTDSAPSKEDDVSSPDVISWVNDRDRPIYMRADTEYSDREGPKIDFLLKKHRPDEFHCRKRRMKKIKSKRKKNSQIQAPGENY